MYITNDDSLPYEQVSLHNPHDTITDITIVNVLFRESMEYHDMHTRPWNANASAQTLRRLEEAVAPHNAIADLTPTALGAVAGTMLEVSAAPDSMAVVPITNGWQHRRFIFMLHVRVGMQAGGYKHFHIQGSTDTIPVSLQSQLIDPEMVMTINNVVESVETTLNTPVTIGGVPQMQRTTSLQGQGVYQVLTNPAAAEGYNSQNLWTMRPQDVHKQLSMSHMAEYSKKRMVVHDQRNTVRHIPLASMRANALTSDYASRLLGSFMLADASGSGMGQQLGATYQAAAENTKEPYLTTNPFITALVGKSLSQHAVGTFRYGNLLALDPTVDKRKHVVWLGQMKSNSPASLMNVSNWKGGDIEERYAANLAHSVPALMTKLMLGEVAFTASNMMSGVADVKVVGGGGFSNSDMSRMYDVFAFRLAHDVLNALSYNNSQRYFIECRSSIIGETTIKIRINDRHEQTFVMPTFCDNLLSPVVSQNGNVLTNMASTFETYMAAASDALGTLANGRTTVMYGSGNGNTLPQDTLL